MPGQVSKAEGIKKAVDEGKFGRVILCKEDGNGNEGKMQHVVLDGVKFSNMDLKFYDEQGNIHPTFKEYTGKPFAFGFTLKEVDRFGNECEMDLAYDMPFNVGEVYHQDVGSMEKELELAIKESIEAYQLEDEKEIADIIKYHNELRGEAHHIFAGVSADVTRDYKAHLIVTTTVAIFDDMLDEACGEKSIPFKESSRMIKHFGDIWMGKESTYVGGEDQELNKFVWKMEKFFYYARKATLKDRSEEETKPFFDSFLAYIKAVSVEISTEWQEYLRDGFGTNEGGKRKRGKAPLYQTLGEWLRIVHGEEPTVESFALGKGIKLGEEIRSSFLVQQMLHLGAEHVSLINDIMSYRREYQNGVMTNIVCLYHSTDNMPLKEAIEIVMEKANGINASMLEIEKMLLKLYGQDEQLVQFLENVKAGVLAHVQWYTFITRYYNDLVLDCIIKV